jgi:hypothetical protein
VAKVIEFYIPTKFPTRMKWLPVQQRGRVIEFRLPPTKSACGRSDGWFFVHHLLLDSCANYQEIASRKNSLGRLVRVS